MSFIIFRKPSKRSWPFLASSALLLLVFILFLVFRVSGGYWTAALIFYLLIILLSYHLWTKKYPQYNQGEYLYMNQAFLKYKRMGVKTDVDYNAFISRFKDDHNPDAKEYKYDAEDRKDENWRSYNRVVSILETRSNLVTKLFSEEVSRELSMLVFQQLVSGEQMEDIKERTLESAEKISPNEIDSYPCDGIVSPRNPLGVCCNDLSFFISEVTSTVNNTVAQVGNGRRVTGLLKYNNSEVNEKQIQDLFYCISVAQEEMLTLNANTAFAYLMNMLAAKSFVSYDWTACFSDKLLKQSTSKPVNHNDLKVAKNKALTTKPIGNKSIDNLILTLITHKS
ncbi:MAG: hypothetical protein Q4D41_06960 [Prevotellaceae bacterium]|nr:hypothetical protein [Prevotellaceae bacterium]